MGRRTGQGVGAADHPRTGERKRDLAHSRQFDQHADPALPEAQTEFHMSTAHAAEPGLGAGMVQLSINTIRTLSIDAVEQAKSGHPGTPMALAPLVYTLWNRVLRFDPQDPIWPDRDRFVLSNGHASMLLWSVLHLTGTRAVNAEYETIGKPSVTLDDIRHFRQLDSKAPGHPEYHLVSGVETTSGPLGQ